MSVMAITNKYAPPHRNTLVSLSRLSRSHFSSKSLVSACLKAFASSFLAIANIRSRSFISMLIIVEKSP
ncbi:unnamed protein product [Gordionus sp. m RMFG-2023]